MDILYYYIYDILADPANIALPAKNFYAKMLLNERN